MRLNIKTKHRQILILTGEDIPEEVTYEEVVEDDEHIGAADYVQLLSGEFTPAPVEEYVYEEDPESEAGGVRKRRTVHQFGFARTL